MSKANLHYFIIVRYSIYLRGKRTGWLIRRLHDHDYRRKLFDPGRLDLHQRLFLGLTLPSVRQQLAHADDRSLTLVVLTSTELPQAWKQHLFEALRPFSWATALEIAPDEPDPFSDLPEIMLHRCVGDRYVTIRLDDDDGLSADYLKQLNAHLDGRRSGFGISLSSGYAGFYDGRTFREYREFHRPMIALGLATVHDRKALELGSKKRNHIFQMGRHTQIDQRIPILTDGRLPAYLRSIHTESDRFKRARRRAESFRLSTNDNVIRCLGFEPIFT